MSFLGIRGIGSLYYLAYALNQLRFSISEELWAVVALIVIISIFIHGIFAAPAMMYIGRMGGRSYKRNPAASSKIPS